MRAALAALLSCALWLAAMPLRADTAANAAICDTAARQAAQATGVPLPVLRAISLTETGRALDGRFLPWPWTVNMEGEGKWFATREEALAYVGTRHALGARSYDLGCFQAGS